MDYNSRLSEILHYGHHKISDVQPSDWAESRMKITIGQYPGPLSYERTPFTRGIVDCLSPYHPAEIVILMGASQVGKTKTIIEPAIAYRISEHPCNIGYFTGHSDLSEESMNKLDSALDNAGLRPLIRANTLRKRNSRTGDTNKSKEFMGGALISGSATNHKLLRQYDFQFVIGDDIEAAKGSSKESGSTVKLLEHRTASYGSKRKIFYCSSPEMEETSIIKPLFLSGDQRYWHIPCQCCGEFITLEWTVPLSGSKEKAGMHWKVDNHGNLIAGSVEYRCQKCYNFFTDRNKRTFLREGLWIPTSVAQDPRRVSFHLSGLLAMDGAFSWEHYVRDWIAANPQDQPPKESLLKVFYNLGLGLTFQSKAEAPQASDIQKNVRDYEIGTIPEQLSIDDGNGQIVLLTCAADMNGKVEDARLDYEIVAWSESGASYSVAHGSIGTFVPKEGSKSVQEDRLHWTYEEGQENSVWPEFIRVIDQTFVTDTGRQMLILKTALDTGYHTKKYAYSIIDKYSDFITGVKGAADDKYIRFTADAKSFKPAQERANLYILQVGHIKDELSETMRLRWKPGNGKDQPAWFMNFPQPAGGLYGYNNFFSHFESENRVIEVDSSGEGIAAKWEKKTSNSQNHMWDCRIYNIAIRDIILDQLRQELKRKTLTWYEFVSILTNKNE